MTEDPLETLRKIALLSQQGARVTMNVKHMNIRQTHVRQVHIASSPTRSATTHVMHSSTSMRSAFDCAWESADQHARIRYRSTKQFAHMRSEMLLSQDAYRSNTAGDHPPRRQHNYGAGGRTKQGRRWGWNVFVLAVIAGVLYWLTYLPALQFPVQALNFPLQPF